MIYVALGGNLPSSHGSPMSTLKAAIACFPRYGIDVVAVSHWYETAPVPVSDQPLYINAVAEVATKLDSKSLLDTLLFIEDQFGRERGNERNAARTLDLDILDFEGKISDGPPILPHPRLQDRAFVLLPLRDVAPNWRYPVTGQPINELIGQVSGVSEVLKIPEKST